MQKDVAERYPSTSLTLRCTNDPNVAACEGQNSSKNLQLGRQGIADGFQQSHDQRKKATQIK